MAEAELLGHWALLAKLMLEDSGDGPLSRVTEETLLEVTVPAISTGLLIPVLSVATYVHAHVYILLAEKPPLAHSTAVSLTQASLSTELIDSCP